MVEKSIACIEDVAPKRNGVNSQIDKIEKAMLACEQVEVPIHHHFAPGVYLREAIMPAGAFIVGHMHKTECMNLLIKGSISVIIDGVPHKINAPYIVKSNAGTRKIAYVHEDAVWVNVHPTNETDLTALEDQLISKSDAFKEYSLQTQESLELLQAHVKKIPEDKE